jgi:hypothetical protein
MEELEEKRIAEGCGRRRDKSQRPPLPRQTRNRDWLNLICQNCFHSFQLTRRSLDVLNLSSLLSPLRHPKVLPGRTDVPSQRAEDTKAID